MKNENFNASILIFRNEQVDEIITTTASKQVDIEVNGDHLKRN